MIRHSSVALILSLALGLLLTPTEACAATLQRHQFVEPHMATLWTITLYSTNEVQAQEGVKAAFQRVDDLERIMTDYDPDSELLRLCRMTPGEPHPISPDLLSIFEASEKVSRQSHGTFDITVGNLVQVWRRARRQREFPELERIRAATATLGWTNLVINARRRSALLKVPGMRLDVGGIAKGFAADAALKVLREHGIRSAMVAASGDFAIGDAPPGEPGWKIQVGDPSGRNEAFGQILVLQRAGISTSGDTEQFVEFNGQRYSHILDPRTGLGVTNRIQATVLAENATRSDALATAVCILGEEAGLKMIERDRRLSILTFIHLGEQTKYRVVPSKRFPTSKSTDQGRPR